MELAFTWVWVGARCPLTTYGIGFLAFGATSGRWVRRIGLQVQATWVPMTAFYLVVEPHRSLRPVRRAPTADVVAAEFRPDPVGRVLLRGPLVGFVAGPSPARARNPVGSCLLACLGASLGIYAGPVVITGLNTSTDVALSTVARIAALTFDQADLVAGVVDDIRTAVEGFPSGRGSAWDRQVRAHAAAVTDGGRSLTAPASWLPGHVQVGVA